MLDWVNLIFEIREMVKIIFEIYDCDNIIEMWDLNKDKFYFLNLTKNIILLLRFEIDSLFDMHFEIENGCWFPEIRGKVFLRFEM